MKLTQYLAAAAMLTALAACQPPAAEQTETPPIAGAETPAPEEQVAATNACGIIAHRNWTATRSAGGSPALTVAGELDLPTPGYSVSLARDANEAAGATEARLTLTLTPPTNMVAQVVTATPVRYFGPAATAYTSVNVNCGGETLTTISVTAG